MSSAKLALASGLVAVALIVSACGIQAKPIAGTAQLASARGNHGVYNDPRTPYLHCLRGAGFQLTRFRSGPEKLPALQIDAAPTGPTVVFEPTPGIAEGEQITAQVEGAEVIGSALVYPNRTSDARMATVEGCLTIGVKG